MTPAEVVGKRVATARQTAGMSQKRLGDSLMPYLGKAWAPQAVSVAEQGQRRFDVTELIALAIVLKRPVGWFFSPTHPFDTLTMPTGLEVTIRDYMGAWWGRGADRLSSIGADMAGLANDLQQQLNQATETAGQLEDLGHAVMDAGEFRSIHGVVEEEGGATDGVDR